MSLTVIKYRQTSKGPIAITPIAFQPKVIQKNVQLIKKPFIKIDGSNVKAAGTTTSTGGGIVINKIPAVVIPRLKRISTTTPLSSDVPQKLPKYVIQTSSRDASDATTTATAIASTSLQWQSSLGEMRKQQLGAALSSLPPNTIIKATSRPVEKNNINLVFNKASPTSVPAALATSRTPIVLTSSTAAAPSSSSSGKVNVASPVRQTVFLKREIPQKTMRSMTIELIDQNPMLYLGISTDRLTLLKRTICRTANVTHVDCYITLRKLRQNESFAVLGECFEMPEVEIHEIFTRTLVKLTRFMRHLLRWPDSKRYADRLKSLPFAYRRNLLQVQSLIECVETDVNVSLDLGCDAYKFILCINTNGIISYVSEAYLGDCDDLQLFEATNFKSIIPKYLSMCSEPGKSVPRTRTTKSKHKTIGDTDSHTDSADDMDDVMPSDDYQEPLSQYDASKVTGTMASMQTLCVVDDALTSKLVPGMRVPTIRTQEPAGRFQMRDIIDTLREFKMLGHCGVRQAQLFSYINEMLIVAAAIINFQR